MGRPWPLVGREGELRQVLGQAADSGVMIVGPPGVGKTRLADEVLQRSGSPHVLRIRATRASATMPLGAFAQVLPTHGVNRETVDAQHLRDAAAHLLSELDADELLYLSVDDVHALDDTSATLLLHLAMTGRVRLVLTVRAGEPVAEPITVLWRDELVGRIDLEPLPDTAVTELLGLVLDGGVDGIASSALTRVCAGNLLYLRELVNGLIESGVLSQVGDTWFLLGPITAPPRLTELVAQRLDALSPGARQLLDAVALAEPVGVHSIEASGSAALIDELGDAGVVELVRDGRRRQLRAVHPMHAEVARATMSEPVRRRLLSSLADANEATGGRRRDDRMRVAAWRLEAGEAADPVALVEGAEGALLGSDAEMARRFAQAALRTDLEGQAVHHRAAHLLGLSLDALGRGEEAEAMLARIEPTAGTGADRAMLAMARSDNLYRGLGRRDDAEAVLLEAERVIDSRELLDELRAQQAVIATLSGDVATTRRLIAPLLADGGDRAFCQAALQASVVEMLCGNSAAATEIAVRAFETRIELGQQVQLAHAGVHLVALGLAQIEAGQIEAALGTASAGYDGAVAERDRHGQAWMCSLLARAHLMAGRVVSAARCAREASVVFGDLRHPGARWGLGALALATGHQGDAEAAEDAVSDLDAERPTPVALMDTELERGRAWAMVAAGRVPAARDALWQAASAARARGHISLEAGALYDIARLGDPSRVLPRLTELSVVIDGDLIAARTAHARSLAAGDAAGLDVAAQGMEVLGANLFAAEAAAAAAHLHRRDGSSRAASASAATAARLGALCEGAVTPALGSETGAEDLTRREREVSRLAADGLSNREIADALVVSVRTVENHLQRAYDKLGISSRDELGGAMARTTAG